jgi:hypothetical protein
LSSNVFRRNLGPRDDSEEEEVCGFEARSHVCTCGPAATRQSEREKTGLLTNDAGLFSLPVADRQRRRRGGGGEGREGGGGGGDDEKRDGTKCCGGEQMKDDG